MFDLESLSDRPFELNRKLLWVTAADSTMAQISLRTSSQIRAVNLCPPAIVLIKLDGDPEESRHRFDDAVSVRITRSFVSNPADDFRRACRALPIASTCRRNAGLYSLGR